MKKPVNPKVTSEYQSWVDTVEYTPSLDGGGIALAPVFEEILKDKRFSTAFEWCAGPAWIGLWLLEKGICSELVTGDINSKSVGMVKKTVAKHNYNARAYMSDNLEGIPSNEKFDLVIANPPNYCNIQEEHSFGFLRNDLRPSDIDWAIHNKFYDSIGPYLADDATMYISEVEPFNINVYLNEELYDAREEVPMKDFGEMTKRNGLEIKKVIPYVFKGSPHTDCYILKIQQSNSYE